MRNEQSFWSPEKVFDFKPKVEEQTAERHWFLWPVRVWQALLYEEAESHLNPLQEVILRLCLTGKREAKEIAERLSLEEGLMEYLKEELTGMGCLGELSEVTEKGKRLLDGSEKVFAAPKVGWFFQDLWTDELMPLVIAPQSIARAEIEWKGEKAVLMSGSKGSPREDLVWVIHPPQKAPLQPSVGDLLVAAERDEKRKRREEGLFERGQRKIGQAKLERENSQIVHIVSFVYLPKEGGRWEVADPFGIKRDIEFRKKLRTLEESERSVEQFFKKIFSEGASEEKKRWDEEERRLTTKAKKYVQEAFPERTLIDDRDVRECLETAWEAWFRWEEMKKTGDGRSKRWEGAIWLGWRQGIEKALGLLVECRPCNEGWRKLYQNNQRTLPRDQVRATLKATARALGFAPRMKNGKERYPFIDLSADQIRIASQERGSSHRIGPRIGACLLSARTEPTHPFWEIAKKAPLWLADLEELIQRAGAAIHAAPTQESSEDQLHYAHEQIPQMINPLLDEIESSSDE